MLFDAIALVLSGVGCSQYLKKSAACDFVKDAYGHLKAIGLTNEARPLVDKAGVESDDLVVDITRSLGGFITMMGNRAWNREKKVRPPLL